MIEIRSLSKDFWLNVLVSFATQLAVAYFLWLALRAFILWFWRRGFAGYSSASS